MLAGGADGAGSTGDADGAGGADGAGDADSAGGVCKVIYVGVILQVVQLLLILKRREGKGRRV